MATETKSNPGLFSGIFFLIASFIMGYVFLVFWVLAIAILAKQPLEVVNLFMTVYYYLLLITALWFFIYSILMFFRQFSKKKALTVTNLLLIILNLVAFVAMCVMIDSSLLGAVFQLMWLYVLIMVVGLFASTSLLKNIKKQKEIAQPKPEEVQPVYTVEGNNATTQLNDINTDGGVY